MLHYAPTMNERRQLTAYNTIKNKVKTLLTKKATVLQLDANKVFIFDRRCGRQNPHNLGDEARARADITGAARASDRRSGHQRRGEGCRTSVG